MTSAAKDLPAAPKPVAGAAKPLAPAPKPLPSAPKPVGAAKPLPAAPKPLTAATKSFQSQLICPRHPSLSPRNIPPPTPTLTPPRPPPRQRHLPLLSHLLPLTWRARRCRSRWPMRRTAYPARPIRTLYPRASLRGLRRRPGQGRDGPVDGFFALVARAFHRLKAGRSGQKQWIHAERRVAFDGFRSAIYDEKTERDRRYGTVYEVSEELNAYLVRLEMPRRLPDSALKAMWQLPDEMPDYQCSLSLADGVLAIRASVRGEAYRRLSYVSSSFPSEFLTRIAFDKPVGSLQASAAGQSIGDSGFQGFARAVRTGSVMKRPRRCRSPLASVDVVAGDAVEHS